MNDVQNSRSCVMDAQKPLKPIAICASMMPFCDAPRRHRAQKGEDSRSWNRSESESLAFWTRAIVVGGQAVLGSSCHSARRLAFRGRAGTRNLPWWHCKKNPFLLVSFQSISLAGSSLCSLIGLQDLPHGYLGGNPRNSVLIYIHSKGSEDTPPAQPLPRFS